MEGALSPKAVGWIFLAVYVLFLFALGGWVLWQEKRQRRRLIERERADAEMQQPLPFKLPADIDDQYAESRGSRTLSEIGLK